MSDTQFRWQARIVSSSDRLISIGGISVAIFAGTFALWAGFVPLNGAALATGTVAAAGRNIQIQHLEGGILRQLLVREGDRITRGQTVLLLDDTAAAAEHKRLVKQLMILRAQIARLSAERDGLDAFVSTFPADLVPYVPEIQPVLDEEQKEFSARLARHRSEHSILGQRVERLNKTLEGLRMQRDAVTEQVEVIREEVGRIKSLLDKGLAIRSDYTDLMRVHADLLGQYGALDAEIAATAKQIAEAEEQIERQKTQRVEEAVTKLNETRVSLADAEERVRAARAVWDRTQIRSPVDGVVVNSIYNVAGNVISPGEKIMEILPKTDVPLVEARLRPTDIDAVKVGQSARLRFVALNARLTPEVGAKVLHISADRIIDQATQEPYYRTILRIDGELPLGLDANELHPGMPVEAYISTGERTFLEYLVRPIIDSASRAFTEE